MILSTHHHQAEENYIDLYGLDATKLSQIGSYFDKINLRINNTTELIKCLGDQYVTLEHNNLNKTRVNIASLLSLL